MALGRGHWGERDLQLGWVQLWPGEDLKTRGDRGGQQVRANFGAQKTIVASLTFNGDQCVLIVCNSHSLTHYAMDYHTAPVYVAPEYYRVHTASRRPWFGRLTYSQGFWFNPKRFSWQRSEVYIWRVCSGEYRARSFLLNAHAEWCTGYEITRLQTAQQEPDPAAQTFWQSSLTLWQWVRDACRCWLTKYWLENILAWYENDQEGSPSRTGEVRILVYVNHLWHAHDGSGGNSSGKSAFANRLDIRLIRQNITNSTVVTLPDNLQGYQIK